MKNFIMFPYVKKGKIKVEKTNEGMTITNNSSKNGRLLFLKKISFNKNEALIFDSKVITRKGYNPYFSFLTGRNLHVEFHVESDYKIIKEKPSKYYFVVVTVPPYSENIIISMDCSKTSDYFSEVKKHFINDSLLISPNYPKESNKYPCAFVHSRMKSYLNEGEKIDLVIVNEFNKDLDIFYEYEGVNVLLTNYNNLRLILQEKKYKKIITHFFSEQFANVFDSINLKKTSLFFYSHGADSIYWDWPITTQQYFMPIFELTSNQVELFKNKDKIIKRYNNYPNVTWIFVSNYLKDRAEKLIGIKFNNYRIIPCLVDEKEFTFFKKNEDLRKKICIVRKFDNYSSYSIDISVRTILDLSTRPIFNDLEFNIYGDGDYHEKLLEPIAHFPNVKIYRKFLNHEEMANVYKENGIALFPSRYDTQGVAACEAAMSGLVVISSKNIGTVEFIDEKIGNYIDTEAYGKYADRVEYYYDNPKQFVIDSKLSHDSVVNTCSYGKTIKKDLNLFNSKFNEDNILLSKEPAKKPLLSIGIAGYNVEKYLEKCVNSIINQKYYYLIEIIIVNDGSKDNTSKIANNLIKKYSEKVKIILIDKENGGHGSAINAALDVASGKYFRLLDGDDYFVSGELESYMHKLIDETADIVLTNYIEDFSIEGIKNVVRHYDFLVPNQKYILEQMSYSGYGFDKWGPLLSTATYKTDNLKKADFTIDENCFYVDMEYNFIGYVQSDSVVFYDNDVYNYYLGRVGQSVSQESFKKNIYNHEKVCIRICKEYYDRISLISKNKQKYILNKIIIPMLKMQYELCYNFNNRSAFLSYDKKLKEYPELYNMRDIAGNITKLHRITKGRLIFLNKYLLMIRKISRS